MALKQSLQQLAGGLVELLRTRVALLSVEMQELAVAGSRALAHIALASLLLLMGAACAVAALVLALPAEYRAAVLAALAVTLLGGALVLGWYALHQARAWARPLAATLQALERDEQALQPGKTDHEAP